MREPVFVAKFLDRVRRDNGRYVGGPLDGIEIRDEGNRHPIQVADAVIAADHDAGLACMAATQHCWRSGANTRQMDACMSGTSRQREAAAVAIGLCEQEGSVRVRAGGEEAHQHGGAQGSVVPAYWGTRHVNAVAESVHELLGAVRASSVPEPGESLPNRSAWRTSIPLRCFHGVGGHSKRVPIPE